MTQHAEIKLGDKYRDKIHGFQGIATQHTRYISGCDRVYLEVCDKEKAELHGIWFDITEIEGLPIAKEHNKPGGPRSEQPSRGAAK